MPVFISTGFVPEESRWRVRGTASLSESPESTRARFRVAGTLGRMVSVESVRPRCLFSFLTLEEFVKGKGCETSVGFSGADLSEADFRTEGKGIRPATEEEDFVRTIVEQNSNSQLAFYMRSSDQQ